ncbi:Glucan 1,3-beta-glucosidase [Psilocybe cubensis]|uniref:Glucan 1,3-beta-glucosidase n=2 Tax=Psilocybe cubensis TaxID=181762 RepID=A0ACB8H2M3_PSICU|nr:Glucan 1,3-beta-glucosidase [Psilocybe cubensis]KAH9481736.1 Glucan 1,3-beta-glucosidase [Psilocybe cubensis]
MRKIRPRNVLPLGLMCLCFEAILLLSGSVVEARQQKCRLQHRNQAVLQPPSNTGIGGVANTSAPTTRTSARTTQTASGTSSSPTPTPFNYGTDTIRGVNIGGWLVLEPWITPSVFESTGNDNIIDEFTLGQLLDSKTAQNILQNHWETARMHFLYDFAQISAAGLNHVRIPIGYWSIPLTSSDTSTSTSTAPYVTGAWPYFLKALSWAEKYNLNVIADLHGAPGSQNGFDNSGQRTNNPVWATNPDNVTRTVDTLVFLAKEVGNQISVLELLNEAAGFTSSAWASVVKNFWTTAYDAVRDVAGDGMGIMIGDAFLGVQSWTNFLTPPQGHGVLMDYHEYQVFSDKELNRTFDEHIDFVCTNTLPTLTSYASSNLWTVSGEWSNAITDCAKWLNGRNVGARWDGTWFPGPTSQVHGSCAPFTGNYTSWSQDYITFLRKYWEVQVELGEAVQGWIFWTWKAENADEWSYQRGLQGGWIPQDPTDRMYPNICS